MELVLWLSLIIMHIHGATKCVTVCWNVAHGLPVTVYELVLWLSSFVMDCLNVVHGLLVTVYMSWGYSTRLAQYSNFMDAGPEEGKLKLVRPLYMLKLLLYTWCCQ